MSQYSSTGVLLKLCTIQTCPISEALVHYVPSLAGNLIYAVLFGILLVAQIFLGVRYRTWTFLGGMVPGILLEIIGYVGRILLHNNPFVMNNFLLYLICLTIGPAFMTASIYLCLSRIVTVCGAQYSRLSPRQYTTIFIGCDLLALILQAVGGALASTAKTHEASQTGTRIMVAGLASQVASMALFLTLWAIFALRVRKVRRGGTIANSGAFTDLRDGRSFGMFQLSLIIATIAIWIRCIYRVAELEGGFAGKLANDEPVFMVLEGPLIIIATALLTAFHPGWVFNDLWIPAGQGTKLPKDYGYALQAVE